MDTPSDSEESPAEPPLETFHRLLRALDYLISLARDAGNETIREWAALADLDAIELGDRLGMLDAEEAEQRREAVRAKVEDLDRR
jgi:hypothetical protein